MRLSLSGALPCNDMAQSAEQVLASIEAAGGHIQDSRSLAPTQPLSLEEQAERILRSTSDAQDQEDLQAEEAAHKAAAAWQLSLQGVLLSLQSKEMIEFRSMDHQPVFLTLDGRQTVRLGSPEYRLWTLLPESGEGRAQQDLEAQLGKDTFKLAQSRAFRNKMARRLPDGSFARAEAMLGQALEDETRAELLEVARTGTLRGDGADKKLAELKKRKMIGQRKWLTFSMSKGPQFALTVQKLETDLTADMLASGAWKKAAFKKYNFDAEGVLPPSGALHPLLKVREEFRHIFSDMGFSEMPTNRFVDSSFWCFDSIFVPQQHPARDVQDTFFVADPPAAAEVPEDYLRRVVQVHEKGDFGSIGYRYPFDRSVTEKLVLRTHTTAVSSAMLYARSRTSRAASSPPSSSPSTACSGTRRWMRPISPNSTRSRASWPTMASRWVTSLASCRCSSPRWASRTCASSRRTTPTRSPVSKSFHITKACESGSRSAIAACSALKCCVLWACPRMSMSLAGA